MEKITLYGISFYMFFTLFLKSSTIW